MEGNTIRNEAGQLVPMRFSDSQEIYWEHVAPNLDAGEKIWKIVLKARQVYSTTFYQNLIFTRTFEYANTNSLILAQDMDSSSSIFEMAKRFYDHLPLPKMKPPKVKEMIFPLPGGISKFKVVSAGTMAKGRGTTQTCLHASEFAFWPHPEVATGLFQAMPNLPNTIWVIESTANGMGGTGKMFYDYWKDAVDGTSELEPIFIPCFVMPKYRMGPPIPESEWDEEEKLLVEQFGDQGVDGYFLQWRRAEIATYCQGSVEQFHQEYPTNPQEAFISSGLPAFDGLAILRQQKNIQDPKTHGYMVNGKYSTAGKGWISLWKEPQDNHQYVIGVDSAEGIKGGDFACGQIVDMGSLEQIGIIHGSIGPWDLSNQLAQVGKWFNNALIVVEIQGTGHAVQDYLIRIHRYPNLHLWRGKPDQVRPHIGKLYGFETNIYSRPLLIEAGRKAINTGLVVIHDESTLEEISKFTRTDEGRYEAEEGHDDRVLALLLALRSREENYLGAQMKPQVYSEYSAPSTVGGIRVVGALEDDYLANRKVQRAIAERAKKAAKHWLEL